MHVMISVAIVMPEIGFDEEPMSPVMRDETVAKKKPKTTIRIDDEDVALRRQPGIDGQEDRQQQRSDQHDRHRDVAFGSQLACRRAPGAEILHASRDDDTIVGSVRPSVIKPAASTAPAPM